MVAYGNRARGPEVWCWGLDAQGQLGRQLDPTFSTKPVLVRGFGSGVDAIAASYSYTCALTFAGGVKCWGENGRGLGDGTRTFSYKPIGVVGLARGVKAIAAGWSHTCALTSKGGVKCWGSNTRGELGGNSGRGSETPVDVVGLGSGVKAITASGPGDSPDLSNDHTCALTRGGGVSAGVTIFPVSWVTVPRTTALSLWTLSG